LKDKNTIHILQNGLCASGNQIITIKTQHFTDLDKLNLVMMVWFQTGEFFITAPAASKNNSFFKIGQSRLIKSLHIVNQNQWQTL
jgi:hypothetical protein